MGGAGSRSRNARTPIPTYNPNAGISRPGAIANTGGIGNVSPVLNRDPQRDLLIANQTIANLNNQIQMLQRGGGLGTSPGLYTPPGLSAPSPYGYPVPPIGGGTYRDTDFAAVAKIAGLNPDDVALLHREFLNLTRGSGNRMDRTVFRHLLRDVLLEANNEQVDRTIENMFVTIDRNRDGFIDFPEFVGAFKDVLKGHTPESQPHFHDSFHHDPLTERLLASGVGTGIAAQPITYVQQAQPATQILAGGGLNIVPLASTAIQQTPIIYGGAAPLQYVDASAPTLAFDQSQSSCVIATPGQYLITQPTALQYMPLPMM